MGSVVFLVAGAFLAFNLFVALSAVPLRNIVVVTPEGPRTISLQPRRLRPVVWLVSGLLALMLAGYASSGWSSYLAYTQAVPFGQVDPVLGRDVSYYLFQWPFLSLAQRLLFAIALLARAHDGGGLCAGRQSGRCGSAGACSSPSARVATCRCSSALLLLALALGDWLEIPQQLFETSGIIAGASYTDVHARIPALRVLTAVGVVGALLAVVQAFSVRLWPITLRDRGLPRRVAGRHGVCHDRAAVLRGAQRAGARDAVHPAQHRGDARGVRPRRRRGAAALGRRAR